MKKIFIGGTGRSGTTILKQLLLNSADTVGYPFELRLNVDPGGLTDLGHTLVDEWSPYAADVALRRFILFTESLRTPSCFKKLVSRMAQRIGFSPLRYTGISCESLIKGAYVEARNRFVASLTSGCSEGYWYGTASFTKKPSIFETNPISWDIYSKAATKFIDSIHVPLIKNDSDELKAWIDDTPYSLLHTEKLLRMYPGMKLIHIYRDPRDVLSSYLCKRWGQGEVENISRRIKNIYIRWFEIQKNIPASIFHEVSLEQISTSPKSSLETICSFLGIQFNENMLKTKLNHTNQGRWKNDYRLIKKEFVNLTFESILKYYKYDI